MVCVHCRTKTIPAVEDFGGSFVSVPVTHFNNAGGWKKQFPSPNHSYVVSFVVYHHNNSTIELCILGALDDENFFINKEAYNQFKANWEMHRKRMTPSYVYNLPRITIPDNVGSRTTPSSMKCACMFVA